MNFRKKHSTLSFLLNLTGFPSFNFPIFQFSNFLIFLFLIFNSSFIIAQSSLDNLTYTYKTNTNQLKYITDAVGSATSAVDLDNQNSTNYAYDASGQLTKDEAEGILNIAWTSSGLVKQVSIDDIDDAIVVANRSLQFKYDALGNRVKKIETDLTGVNPPLTTYYIRNATGDLVSIYEEDGSTVERKEVSIAVGTDKAASDSITNGVFSRNVGLKNYELKDHIGSVRVVINDVKNPVAASTTFTNNIQHAADYYSYGALMPGRDYNISTYRFGFQGKEKDDELKGSGNSYDFGARLLDPRVGRWLTIDPKADQFADVSPYNAMANNPNNMVDPDGKAAWPVQREWAKSDVEGYAKFVPGAVADLQQKGMKFDCADLQITLLVMYAAQNGLPVSFHTASYFNQKTGKTKPAGIISSNDDFSKFNYDANDPEASIKAFIRLLRVEVSARTILQDMSPLFPDGNPTPDDFFSTIKIGDLRNSGFHAQAYSGKYEIEGSAPNGESLFRVYLFEGNVDFDLVGKVEVNPGIVPRTKSKFLYNATVTQPGALLTKEIYRWNVLNFPQEESPTSNNNTQPITRCISEYSQCPTE